MELGCRNWLESTGKIHKTWRRKKYLKGTKQNISKREKNEREKHHRVITNTTKTGMRRDRQHLLPLTSTSLRSSSSGQAASLGSSASDMWWNLVPSLERRTWLWCQGGQQMVNKSSWNNLETDAELKRLNSRPINHILCSVM